VVIDFCVGQVTTFLAQQDQRFSRAARFDILGRIDYLGEMATAFSFAVVWCRLPVGLVTGYWFFLCCGVAILRFPKVDSYSKLHAQRKSGAVEKGADYYRFLKLIRELAAFFLTATLQIPCLRPVFFQLACVFNACAAH